MEECYFSQRVTLINGFFSVFWIAEMIANRTGYLKSFIRTFLKCILL